ncbi:MAG TPA: type II secretion system F family protein [Candidatus Tyrphobacter sp.]
MLLLVPLLVVGAIGVIVYAVTSSNSEVKGRLAAINASAGLGGADDAATLFQRLLNDQRRNRLEVRLQEAGWYGVTPAKLHARSGVYGAIGAGIGFVIMLIMHSFTPLMAMGVVALAGFGAYRPYGELAGAVKRRKVEVYRSLPDFLDLLSTTIEAGVALNSAIAVAAEGLKGALGEELRAALQDVRLGRSRAEALIAMASRVREPDLTTVVTALVQSERVGASLTHVVDELAADSRDRRLMRAEELAAALSNKLVFPMALFMLPALFIMIFGGVFSRYLHH